jgi:hypothetical protein
MATINVNREVAIERIESKISEAKKLKEKLTTSLDPEVFKNELYEAEEWKINTVNTLQQVFSDNILADTFTKIDLNKCLQSPELSNKITILNTEISSGIKKLENILTDIRKGLFYTTIHPQLRVAQISLWKSIIITIAGALISAFFAYKSKSENSQGLRDLTLQGKWKYICTSFDGTYQHGGRFEVQKGRDGSLFLSGERMWRDTEDTLTGKWNNRNYTESEYLQWYTNWIYVNNSSQMNFEYVIPTKTKNILGYCTGRILSNKKLVEYVKGNFYVLTETPILTGQIIFKRVSDSDYYSITTLPKNH